MTQSELLQQMSIVSTLQEIKHTIIGNTLGLDGMELIHFGGDCVTSAVFALIILVLEGTPVLQDMINGILVSILKGKDSKSA